MKSDGVPNLKLNVAQVHPTDNAQWISTAADLSVARRSGSHCALRSGISEALRSRSNEFVEPRLGARPSLVLKGDADKEKTREKTT